MYPGVYVVYQGFVDGTFTVATLLKEDQRPFMIVPCTGDDITMPLLRRMLGEHIFERNRVTFKRGEREHVFFTQSIKFRSVPWNYTRIDAIIGAAKRDSLFCLYTASWTTALTLLELMLKLLKPIK